ncbi:unnamed protein product [Musa acuminata var. zebrina]
MLLHDAPIGIFTQSPNVMDLVKSDGAALYFRNQVWLLGMTPTELQIRDIVAWLMEYHDGSTGLSTDSMTEAGYPGAAELGDAVCGMAAIKITSRDFIFWFRSHTTKETKWGNINGWNSKAADLTGLPVQEGIGMPLIDLVEDDSVEVAKKVLQLALRGKEEKNIEIKLKSFSNQDSNSSIILVVNSCCSHDMKDIIVGVCFVGQDVTRQKLMMDKNTRIQNDYVAVVRNPSKLIPPIFMINESGCCSEWNSAMEKVSGTKRRGAIDKMLVGELFCHHGFGYQVKDHDALTKLKIVLNGYVEALISVNKRMNSEGKIAGTLCFLHVASPELQHSLQVQKMSEQVATNSLKELAYLRQEIRNSLNGITFMQDLMETTDLTDEQKQLLRRKALCQEPLAKILDGMDLENIEQCYMELDSVEFHLGETLDVVINQVMTLSRERQVVLLQDWSAEVSSMHLYGDNLRLQQILADLLSSALQFAPVSQGSILLQAVARKELTVTGVQIVHIEFRIIDPAPGIPEALVQEMFQHSQGISRGGHGLYVSQKLVKIMNGTVQYVRETVRSSFIIILLEFPLVKPHRLENVITELLVCL